MSRRFWVLALAVSVAVVLGAGCGGGGGSSSTDAAATVNSSLTGAQFRKQANAICNEGKAESVMRLVHKAEQEGKASAAELSAAYQVDSLVTSLQKELGRLEGLGLPAGEERQVEAIFKAFKDTIAEFEEKEDELAKSSPAGLGENLQPVLLHIFAPAKSYGLKGCAYGH